MKYIIKNINDFTKENIYDFYEKISNDKKVKIDKLVNYDAKARSIIGEMLLKELLSKKNITYESLIYDINNYGKPYLKNEKLFFNISHSFNYVITIISDKEIGIDIEKIRKTPVNVINQFATKKEKEYILSSNNINEKIFEIYTLKEAYFKMLGKNLNDILSVEFRISKDKVICSDKNVNAGFIKDIDGYIISYCEKI